MILLHQSPMPTLELCRHHVQFIQFSLGVVIVRTVRLAANSFFVSERLAVIFVTAKSMLKSV